MRLVAYGLVLNISFIISLFNICVDTRVIPVSRIVLYARHRRSEYAISVGHGCHQFP